MSPVPPGWLVGVDAGASRTTAWVADRAGLVFGQAVGPGGAVEPGGGARAAAVIAETVHRALAAAGAGRAVAMAVGAAGAGREPERSELERALAAAGLAQRLQVTTDLEIALVAALGDGPGILLLAGTGSSACARLPSGELRRTGGQGWRFGDEGSGYWLARAALGAVAQAGDGRGPPTALGAALARAAGVSDEPGLLAWARSASKSALADLARVVQQVATQGDPVAVGLIQQAAGELVAHVRALLAHFPGEHPVPVALAGGLLGTGQPVREAVFRQLAEAFPRTRPSHQPVEPPRGALALAARLI